MRSISIKTSFLAFTLIVGASLGGVLTACSNTSGSGSTGSENQSQTPNAPATHADSQQHMQHGGGMEHGSGMDRSMTMNLGPADATYDLRFIDAMIPHHQGAVEMAKEAEQKSQRPEIKKLAADIIIAQNKEIELLLQWRTAWYPQASAEPVAYGGEGKAVVPMSEQQHRSMMMSSDLGAADAEFDRRFINAMIPHHEAAVKMATDAQSKAKHPEIKKLAQDIVTAQQKEIDQMKQWRQSWYKR